jgi:hypothetical protein
MNAPFRSFPRRPLTWLVAFTIIAGLVGCFEFPLGDPEKSKADDRFAGLWLQKEPGSDAADLISIVPFDARTFVVTDMKFTRDAQNRPTLKEESTYKMWLTTVGGSTFATLESKDAKTLLPDPKPSYVVLKIARDDNVITAHDLNEKFVSDANVTTPEGLEKLIAANLANPSLLGEKATFDLLTPDRAEEAKSILTAFGRRI